jgi:putative transposase
MASATALGCEARRRSDQPQERQRKAKLRVVLLAARIATQRRDFSHKLSRSLVSSFSHIAMEDLNVKGLAGGMLAKSGPNAAWNQLARHLAYNAANAGGAVVLVDPRYSSQRCPECGTIKRKTLTERMHRCGCGCVLDRDVAAAKVVLLRADFPGGTPGQAPSQRMTA